MSEKLERREFLKPLNIQSLYTEQRIEVLHRIAETHEARLDDLERRIEKMERKLNHKGGDDGRRD